MNRVLDSNNMPRTGPSLRCYDPTPFGPSDLPLGEHRLLSVWTLLSTLDFASLPGNLWFAPCAWSARADHYEKTTDTAFTFELFSSLHSRLGHPPDTLV